MNVQTQVDKITKYSSLAVAWVGKSAVVLMLIAVLGYTQRWYGLDVRLSSGTPMVQVQLVALDGLPRLSWRKLVCFTSALFHSSSPSLQQQACRQHQKRQLG